MLHDPNQEPSDQLLSDLMNLRNLLSSPENWTQQKLWRKSQSEETASFCIMGGVQVTAGYPLRALRNAPNVYGSKDGERRVWAMAEVIARAAGLLHGHGYLGRDTIVKEIECLNDGQFFTHPALLEILDKAIASHMEAKIMEKARAS